MCPGSPAKPLAPRSNLPSRITPPPMPVPSVTATRLSQLSATIRKKLVLEIANLDIEPDAAPVQYADAREVNEPGIMRAQLRLPTEKSDCFAGEKARAMREGGSFP